MISIGSNSAAFDIYARLFAEPKSYLLHNNNCIEQDSISKSGRKQLQGNADIRQAITVKKISVGL